MSIFLGVIMGVKKYRERKTTKMERGDMKKEIMKKPGLMEGKLIMILNN